MHARSKNTKAPDSNLEILQGCIRVQRVGKLLRTRPCDAVAGEHQRENAGVDLEGARNISGANRGDAVVANVEHLKRLVQLEHLG